MMEDEYNITSERISLYIRDIDKFKKIQKEIIRLWFEINGYSINITQMIEIALDQLQNNLLNQKNDNKRQNLHKYLRTGLRSK